MRLVRRILAAIAGLVVLAVIGLAIYLGVAPPELLRVADGYAAKIVCSNVFLANRDANEVLSVDVQAPGNPVLKLIGVALDKDADTVTTKMLGYVAPQVAVYRPGFGCTLAPDGKLSAVAKMPAPGAPATGMQPWSEAPDPKVAALLADDRLAGPGVRAVVVVKDGKIVAERYAPGFAADTPLLGWSMAKTVTGILLGQLIMDGKLSLDDAGLFPDWSDARKAITVAELVSMTSGLQFNEDYGDVSDVNRMLFLEPDMANFAASQPLVAQPGSRFSYSTGTAVMLSRLWMDRVRPDAANFPQTSLFAPLDLHAVIEPDEVGTLIGSSYMYAPARDWARLGQLLVQGGVWNGQRLLPEGFVQLMQTPNGLSGGYSKMLTWLEPDAGLPPDSFWLEGHDGQSVAVIPATQLLVVRMGLTPSSLGYSAVPLVKAVLAATSGT